MENIEIQDARLIIESFRQGIVPIKYLDFFSIGRGAWLDSVFNDLEFISKGGSKVRFISAPYGGGKTHFLMQIRKKAISKNFITSYVELHSRESPFDKFEIIFSKIIREIVYSNDKGIEALFTDWAKNYSFYKSSEIEGQLRKIASSLDFRSALRTYLEIVNTDSQNNLSIMQRIQGWLQGERITSEFSKLTGMRNPVKSHTITGASRTVGREKKLVKIIVHQVCGMVRNPRNFL